MPARAPQLDASPLSLTEDDDICCCMLVTRLRVRLLIVTRHESSPSQQWMDICYSQGWLNTCNAMASYHMLPSDTCTIMIMIITFIWQYKNSVMKRVRRCLLVLVVAACFACILMQYILMQYRTTWCFCTHIKTTMSNTVNLWRTLVNTYHTSGQGAFSRHLSVTFHVSGG